MCLRHDSSQSLWHVSQWGQSSHCVGCSSVKWQRRNSSLEQLHLIKHCLALIRLCLTHLCLAYSHFYPDSRFTGLDMRAFQWVRNECTKIRHRIPFGCVLPGRCSSLLGSNVDALEGHVLVDDFFFPLRFLWRPSSACHHLETAGPWWQDALCTVWGSLERDSATYRMDRHQEELWGWRACLGKIMHCESVNPLTKLVELKFLFSKL